MNYTLPAWFAAMKQGSWKPCSVEWRGEFRLQPDREFHGYQLRRRADVFLRFVETALNDAQVFALEYDKQVLEEQVGRPVYDKPAHIAPATGLLVAEYAFTAGELKTLTYDAGDIAEKNSTYAVPHRGPADGQTNGPRQSGCEAPTLRFLLPGTVRGT